MIFVDKLGHLISDHDINELHEFARKIGLKQEWFQDKKNDKFYYPHYDLTTPRKRIQARLEGAIEVDPRELLRLIKEAPYNSLSGKGGVKIV